MESLPKEVINDILQFNKYPHEVYKICYFAVSLECGGIDRLNGFFEVVDNDGEYDLDQEHSIIKKSFLDKILEKELPYHFANGDTHKYNGFYGRFEPIIYKIIRIN